MIAPFQTGEALGMMKHAFPLRLFDADALRMLAAPGAMPPLIWPRRWRRCARMPRKP